MYFYCYSERIENYYVCFFLQQVLTFYTLFFLYVYYLKQFSIRILSLEVLSSSVCKQMDLHKRVYGCILKCNIDQCKWISIRHPLVMERLLTDSYNFSQVYPMDIYAFGLIAWIGGDALNKRFAIIMVFAKAFL